MSCLWHGGTHKLLFYFGINYDCKEFYKKTACQNQIKIISDDYLELSKALQLFTRSFTLNTNIFTNTTDIKTHTHTNIYAITKVIKNAKLTKAWVD